MALYDWEYKDWKIEIGTGTPDPLNVDKWPVLEWVKRPTRKESGIFPKKLTLNIIDTDGTNGYLSDRVADSPDVVLTLDSATYFKGSILPESIPRPVGEVDFPTQITVSDGIEALTREVISGTFTIEEFLLEMFTEPIHVFTDFNVAGSNPVTEHRITIESKSKRQALADFCNDFGYQVWQQSGVWIVRSLSFFSGNNLTRYIINDGVTSDSYVSFADIPELYKSSVIDLLRPVGRVETEFSWSIESGDFRNTEFDNFQDGEFPGWVNQGTPTQVESGSTNFARLDNNSDRLIQFLPGTVRIGDRVTIDAQAIAEFTTSPSGVDDATWLEIIFKDYRGQNYWLQNDLTVSTSQAFIREDNVTSSILQFNESFIVTSGAGFPSGFSGTFEVRCIVDRQFSGGSFEFAYFDHQFCRVSVELNTPRRTKLNAFASAGSGTVETLSLTNIPNNPFYRQNYFEFNDSGWKAADAIDSTTFAIKRMRDELRVRNTPMKVLHYKGDFTGYEGANKLYLYDGDRYIVMHEKIEIGIDEVELLLIKHEVTSETITIQQDLT